MWTDHDVIFCVDIYHSPVFVNNWQRRDTLIDEFIQRFNQRRLQRCLLTKQQAHQLVVPNKTRSLQLGLSCITFATLRQSVAILDQIVAELLRSDGPEK